MIKFVGPRSRVKLVVLCGTGLLIVATLAGMLLQRMAQRHREVTGTTTCIGNLTFVNELLLRYYRKHGTFPPATVRDAMGNPMHSWRILILEDTGIPVYEKYSFNEAWDGPSNRRLWSKMPAFFRCPNDTCSSKKPWGYTSYLAVVGPNTAFPVERTTRLAEITDNHSDTMLILESANSGVNWLEPRDMIVSALKYPSNEAFQPSISSNDLGGPAILFVDGSRRRLARSVDDATLKAMATISGGETIDTNAIGVRP